MLCKALTRSGIALALTGLLASAAGADTFTLRDKKQVQGDVIELTEKAVRIRTATNELVLLGFEKLAPDSLYGLLRGRVDAKDAKARLELSDTCKRWKAYDGARSELEAAVKLDPKLAKTAAAKRKSIDETGTAHSSACSPSSTPRRWRSSARSPTGSRRPRSPSARSPSRWRR
ncbi:MAG: hypothetical protein ACYTGX_03700 [Planctomycetota bacterium]|jgi:hypothetical protein